MVIDTFLFDWGDTLMRDIPGKQGKMCDWDFIEVIDGAESTLGYLSQTSKIYVATGAQDSSVADIEKAFGRGSLDRYISGYFCKQNIGLAKGSQQFYRAILSVLDAPPENVAMIGDSLEKDILPALAVGMRTYWLTSNPAAAAPAGVITIASLTELCG